MPQHLGAVFTRMELNGELLDPLYLAAVEAVDEAVINAIVAGEDVAAVKPEGLVVKGIDTAKLTEIFRN